MDAGALLKEGCVRSGLTQDELAARVGCSANEISRWERGRVALTFARLDQLIEACGLELDIALRPLDRSRDSLLIANLGRTPTARLRGMERQLRRMSEIQGAEGIFEPIGILESLVDAGVDFVVIGGVAAVLHGSPFPTMNLDLMVRDGARNHDRVWEAVEALGPSKVRAADFGSRYATVKGQLRVFDAPTSMPGYGALRRRAPLIELGRRSVRVAPQADVIRSAEARPVPGRRAELLALRRLISAAPPESV